MCILIHHTEQTAFGREHLADFYSRNSDGFGALIKGERGMEVVKTLGNLDEIEELYKSRIFGREAIIHFRMQTHGDIDMTNCHPYQVTNDIWMAHNGVLSTGNAADKTKSDTWHYINDYLKPMLEAHPELIHNPAFIKMVGDHIGTSNKFGFMDYRGRIAIVNRSAGVEHFNAWLSNTYAWTPSKWGYYTAQSRYYSGWDWEGGSTWRDDYTGYGQQGLLTYGKGAGTSKVKKPMEVQAEESRKRQLGNLSTEALGRILRSSYNAMQRNQAAGLVDWVIANPMKAMHLLWEFYKGQLDEDGVSIMVHADPDEAADWIEEMWETAGDECMQMAGIPHEINDTKGLTDGYPF